MTRFALTGARIFTGDRFLDGQAALIAAGRILAVVPEAEVPAETPVEPLTGGLLAPGFIDVQVNGGGGVLFNDTPEVEALARLAQAHARHGTTALLPTFITDDAARMRRAIDAVKAAQRSVPGVLGIHLEGPFLAPARKGAHDANHIRPLTEADVSALLETDLRPLLLTLAPEQVAPALIARLAAGGVTVSLGHSDARYEVAMAAADAGARGATHVFNAMSPLSHRAPGMVGAALDHGSLWGGIIADGHHVHPAALAIALRAKRGPARLFLVTDAMPTAGHSDDEFHLNGRKVVRRDGVLTLEDGTLAGSDLTMDAALRFAVDHLDVSLAEALRMASLYPALFLGLDADYGRITPGCRADLVHLSPALAVQSVWINGRPVR
ncbi:N-acetylglucosamine-6-phosphate deacetylase [Elstera cyanobacteriorum]|uniref:N-acetylglucosamine-6-phosphate deacetylase n=1 Tax=Elstera cyanobacteriorum TaxID=2022747 RepID=UPI002355A887|nr:N-acetylglucosamine-6-phosphate deacetylase [Elstera cyanobacteriorum]MCK6444233.1 N-acetylglucosamine-6-phosphate deacetylase [Elstera cyanobacteriorum]